MNRVALWLIAVAIAIAMSMAWDDDEALQATADCLDDAVRAAQITARDEAKSRPPLDAFMGS